MILYMISAITWLVVLKYKAFKPFIYILRHLSVTNIVVKHVNQTGRISTSIQQISLFSEVDRYVHVYEPDEVWLSDIVISTSSTETNLKTNQNDIGLFKFN